MKNLGTVRLETDRLILRRFEISDASKVYKSWATDKECTKQLSWEVHENMSVTETMVKKWIKD